MIGVDGVNNNRNITIELNNLNHNEKKYEDTNITKEKDPINKKEVIISDGKGAFKSRLRFSIHEKTKDIMVEIIDIDTKEVIREIPPKMIKDLIANILEAVGLLIDKKA